MRQVLIWENDGEPIAGQSYSKAIVRQLSTAGFTPLVVPVQTRGLTEEEMRCPNHILTGGATPADSSEEWMQRSLQQLKGVLSRADAGKTVVVGICLGSQMLATVLLGRYAARANPIGIEVGLKRVNGVGHVPDIPAVAQFHYEDIISDILSIDGVTHLYENGHTRIQGFSFHDRIFGYQFHLELTPDEVIALIKHNKILIADHDGDIEHILQSTMESSNKWSPELFDNLVLNHLC